MSFVTRTDIQLGPAIQLRPPHTATELGSVRLDNHSPYLLGLNIDSASFSLPPHHSRTFTFPTASGAPVYVDPENPDNAPIPPAAYVIATWFAQPEVDPDSNDQQVPMAVPAATLAAAIAAQLAPMFDNLATQIRESSSGTGTGPTTG